MRKLSEAEEKAITGGEALTLATVMAILVIGLVSIIAYKFFTSDGGKATLPGGFTFQWD